MLPADIAADIVCQRRRRRVLAVFRSYDHRNIATTISVHLSDDSASLRTERRADAETLSLRLLIIVVVVVVVDDRTIGVSIIFHRQLLQSSRVEEIHSAMTTLIFAAYNFGSVA